MKGKVLITGGAGFIGSNLAQRLFLEGYQLVVLDKLSPQIHGEYTEFPELLSRIADCILGDVADPDIYHQLPKDFDFVVHLAAETGTGQSMYAISQYSEVNVQGTALFMEHLAKQKKKVKKIILSSTRAVYGEGAYRCPIHGLVFPEERRDEDLAQGKFDPFCPICNQELVLVPTREDALFRPLSVYGITKISQELLLMQSAKSFGIPAVALRFQNVYGLGQSLSNPYTGILSIFSTRIRHGQEIDIFEDGNESRDFVYINDVVDSVVLALEKEEANGEVFNIGSGNSTSVLEVSKSLKEKLNASVNLNITGKYRVGDIRHNVADISKAKSLLGYSPKVSLEEGLSHFVEWVLQQPLPEDKSEKALTELKDRGLFK
jgi:dTDP-L-rhamnose 4-epimerase